MENRANKTEKTIAVTLLAAAALTLGGAALSVSSGKAAGIEADYGLGPCFAKGTTEKRISFSVYPAGATDPNIQISVSDPSKVSIATGNGDGTYERHDGAATVVTASLDDEIVLLEPYAGTAYVTACLDADPSVSVTTGVGCEGEAASVLPIGFFEEWPDPASAEFLVGDPGTPVWSYGIPYRFSDNAYHPSNLYQDWSGDFWSDFSGPQLYAAFAVHSQDGGLEDSWASLPSGFEATSLAGVVAEKIGSEGSYALDLGSASASQSIGLYVPAGGVGVSL